MEIASGNRTLFRRIKIKRKNLIQCLCHTPIVRMSHSIKILAIHCKSDKSLAPDCTISFYTQLWGNVFLAKGKMRRESILENVFYMERCYYSIWCLVISVIYLLIPSFGDYAKMGSLWELTCTLVPILFIISIQQFLLPAHDDSVIFQSSLL